MKVPQHRLDAFPGGTNEVNGEHARQTLDSCTSFVLEMWRWRVTFKSRRKPSLKDEMRSKVWSSKMRTFQVIREELGVESEGLSRMVSNLEDWVVNMIISYSDFWHEKMFKCLEFLSIRVGFGVWG